MSPLGNDESPFVMLIMNSFAKVLAWVLERILCGLKVSATWLGRRMITFPIAALLCASPIVGVVALRPFIENGTMGKIVRVAWHNEEVYRKNISTAETFLKTQQENIPAHVYKYQRAALGAAEYERRKVAREDWEQQNERAKEMKRKNGARIPSMLQPLGPSEPIFESAPEWEAYYRAYHFLFRSCYSSIVLLYLVIGLFFAWQQSPERNRLHWLAAKKKSGPGNLLLGLDTTYCPYFFTRPERNHHALIAGTTGSGKTEALGLLAPTTSRRGTGSSFST